MELERLKSIGGRDKIVPNEGIVFTYKGGTYKLTGTFFDLLIKYLDFSINFCIFI